MYDASYTAADEILAAAFRYSHLVFASTTYNAGIYIAMENLLHDIVNHNLQNRTVALIENGSWAPAAGGLMHDLLAQLPGTKFIDQTVTVRSSLKERQMCEIDAMVQAIAATMPGVCAAQAKKPDARAILRTSPAEMAAAGGVEAVDPNAMFKFSYGLFVLTAKDGAKDNGCIINTASQLTDTPKRITVAVNKANYTHDMILRRVCSSCLSSVRTWAWIPLSALVSRAAAALTSSTAARVCSAAQTVCITSPAAPMRCSPAK